MSKFVSFFSVIDSDIFFLVSNRKDAAAKTEHYHHLLKEQLAESLARTVTYGGWDSVDGIETFTGWTVRESNPSGGRYFPCRPEQFRGAPSLLYKRVICLSGVTRDASHLPVSIASVVSGLEIHLRTPSVPV